MYVTYSVCVCVALGTPHAMRMRHIVFCGLLGFTVSHKRHDFQKKASEHGVCFLIVSTSFV